MKENIKRVIIEFETEEAKTNNSRELFEDVVSELALKMSNIKNEDVEEESDKEEDLIVTLEQIKEELKSIKDKISMVERFIDTNYPEFLVDGFKNYFDTLVDEQRALEQLIKEIELYFSIPF